MSYLQQKTSLTQGNDLTQFNEELRFKKGFDRFLFCPFCLSFQVKVFLVPLRPSSYQLEICDTLYSM